MEYCESCGHAGPTVRWYLFDHNAEVTLHPKCARELREAGETVEAIK